MWQRSDHRPATIYIERRDTTVVKFKQKQQSHMMRWAPHKCELQMSARTWAIWRPKNMSDVQKALETTMTTIGARREGLQSGHRGEQVGPRAHACANEARSTRLTQSRELQGAADDGVRIVVGRAIWHTRRRIRNAKMIVHGPGRWG